MGRSPTPAAVFSFVGFARGLISALLQPEALSGRIILWPWLENTRALPSPPSPPLPWPLQAVGAGGGGRRGWREYLLPLALSLPTRQGVLVVEEAPLGRNLSPGAQVSGSHPPLPTSQLWP